MNVRTTMQHQVVSMRLSGDVWFLLSLFNEKKYFMVMDGRTDLPPPHFLSKFGFGEKIHTIRTIMF